MAWFKTSIFSEVFASENIEVAFRPLGMGSFVEHL